MKRNDNVDTFLKGLYTLWNQILYAISEITVFDVIDIIIVAYIVYKGIQFFSESRGGQLVKGLIILFVGYMVSVWFNLDSVHWLLEKVMDWGIIALAVIFQPEIRRALERIGRTKIGQFGQGLSSEEEKVKDAIDRVCFAAQTMHDQRIGALIVFERTTSLGDIINTGTAVNADITAQLVGNIFYPKSPLHDGAMIIRDGKIVSAGCILPLTSNPNINSQLGTRHRAAIGMSEVSDAIVLVVSEETGKISLVQNGNIERGYDQIRLRDELYKLLLENDDKNVAKTFFGRLKNIFSFKNKKEQKKGEDVNGK